ncbi:MAG: hypothetical protein U1E19_02400 [Rhodoblastus sp.]
MKFENVGAVALLTLAVTMPIGAKAQEFSNEEASCVEYADWITDLMRKGQRAGCDFSDAGAWFDPQKQINWCMGQSANAMRNAAATARGHLKTRCARRGIDSRTIR